MSSKVDHQSDHGELKRRLADLLGTDPERYATGTGTERHKVVTSEEVDRVCEELGIGFVDGSKQEKRDTVMIKLGRDHRTGASMWDSSDLLAVIRALDGDESGREVEGESDG